MEHNGTPAHAAVALVAAGLGAVGSYCGPDHWTAVFAAAGGAHWPTTPDELYAWAKAIANSAFMLVNAAVGCWHLVTMGHASYKRRTGPNRPRRKDPPPSGPAPHTDPDGGV